MATQLASPTTHPIFNTRLRSYGLPVFSLTALRQTHYRSSVQSVSILMDSDSEDEGISSSYHSLRRNTYECGRALSPDDLEKRRLVMPSSPLITTQQKKPVDTSNKWDYYVAPLSPLSDLTDSEASDSDDDIHPPKPMKPDEASGSPRSAPRSGMGTLSASAHSPSPSPTLLKRKRSCQGPALDTSPVKDSEGPSKRRRMSGPSERSFGVENAKSSTTSACHPLSMSPEEIKNSIHRNAKKFGTLRKPRTKTPRRQMGSRP